MRARYPNARIIVCANDDHHTPGNPGLTQAQEAARKVYSCVAVPDFGADRPEDATDFNDVHRLRGLSAVRTTLDGAAEPASAPGLSTRPTGAVPEIDWPEPDPLTAPGESQPYPVSALPPVLRDAVTEAQSFVQSPAALVACSALSALSLAAQGLANVRRDHHLVGPVSLHILAVAESGERKSTCDRIFGAALRDWERDQAVSCAPGITAHETAVATAEAKRAGLLEAIKRKRRDMQETAEEEAALQVLAGEASSTVKVPRLLYTDATPEALSHALATGWPSAALGGLVPTVLDLSPPGHAAWVQAYDAIERELANGGNYAPIRDVAAKAAENIARLAALFHMLDHGATGTIDHACVDSATQIVRWHLQQAHRLLGDFDAPPVMAAAIRFDAWLRDEALRTGDGRIPTTRVYRYGPGCVRDNKDLKDAVALLAEHGRARLEEEGRRRFVVVNPALYAGWSLAADPRVPPLFRPRGPCCSCPTGKSA